MSDLITLLSLRTRTRQRADMVGSNFCTDTEINGYITDSYKELYDMLVDAVEDYNLSSASSTITTGSTFNLPSDFYKLRGLDDMQDTSTPRTVKKYLFGERNDYPYSERLAIGSEYSDVLYRIVGATIQIVPPERAARTYRLWYVPTPTIPASDVATIDAVNGFDEYIVIDAAIKCLIKEESSTTALEKQKANIVERIARMKANRDQGNPERVTRVRNRRRGYSYLGESSL